MSKRDQLNAYLKQVEKRLRLDILLRGAAILTLVALATTAILVLATNALAFSEGSISGARLFLLAAVVAALGLGSALPLYALNRRHAAGQVETAFPSFQQRLLTFVDRDAGRREPFMELLATDTLELARKADPTSLVPRRKLLASIAAALVCVAILIWMIVDGPGFWGYGAARLWAGTSRSVVPFYDIRITPGDATVRRNAPQKITAQLVGFQSPRAHLYARSQSASKWEEAAMQPQEDGPGFQFVFPGVAEDVEYYVEAGSVRSRHHLIRATDLPAIRQIHVTYHYPAWTGLRDAVDEHGGDLRAVEGTEAELSILTDRLMRGGVLVLDNQQQVTLAASEGNLYQGTIKIERDGQYHLAGVDQGQLVRLSDDFFIEANKKTAPEVSITRPGADYRASPIEEVTLSVKAHDDYGLKDVSLRYSVNGGAQRQVKLLKQKGVKEADGSTTLYLEDFKLVPGDVVSVYAKASGASSESRSGMVFIQAEPFEREYSQSQASGGMSMGGQEFDIAQREREIIGATWQQNDKAAARQQAAESAKFLSDVQSKLRAQALTLAGRLQSRELAEANEQFSAFQQDMNAAAEAMAPASEKLKRQQWEGAIPDEEKALQHLLRAQATFRQIQVAFGSGGGGGAGAGAGGDLANLLNLELDTEKNQYEAGQTAASAGQRAEQIDKALQKLDELARRQQDLADQRRDTPSQGSEQRWQQEMLRREAEQLQKQLEQLAQGSGSRNQPGSQSGSPSSSSPAGSSASNGRSQATVDERIQRALDQLRQARDDMRRAASQGQTAADARRAADRLREASGLINGIRQQQGSGQLDSLVQEADRLAAQSHDQAARITRKFSQKNPASPMSGFEADEDQAKLADNRQLMATDLARLEKATQDAAHQLASAERESASKLRQALGEMDGSNLQSRLQQSAQSMRLGMPPDPSFESSINSGIERFDQRLHEARQALKGSEGSDDTLARLERLRRQVDALTRDLGTAGREQPGAQGQSGQQSQPGSRAPGQAGQAQNWQSQGGQQGQQGGYGHASQNGQAGGFQPGGPGGPRIWRGGTRGSGDLSDSGQPEMDSSSSPASRELSRQGAIRDLDGLRREVPGEPDTLADIQTLMRDLQRLGPGTYGNAALEDQLRARVLATMDNLELRLRRQLDQQESGQVRSADSLRVPKGYEESVAEYFRRLSKTRQSMASGAPGLP